MMINLGSFVVIVLGIGTIFVQMSPWQLFQKLCPLYSPYSLECQQQLQQPLQPQVPLPSSPSFTPYVPPSQMPLEAPLPNDAPDGEGEASGAEAAGGGGVVP
jgi:hypothetical protein